MLATGESLYEMHRQELCHQGITSKGRFNDHVPPLHWFELDERLRQAWEATSRQVNEAHGRQLRASLDAYGPT